MGTTQTHYFHDNFKTTEHIKEAVTQTGYITPKMHEYKLETGIQNLSMARFYYTNPIYNPKYSILQLEARMNSMQDCIVFFGFGDQTMYEIAPSAFRGSGVFIINGIVHFLTASDKRVRTTPLPDIDLTDNWLFRLDYDKLYTRPLPQKYPYFDGIRVVKTAREWALAAQHGDAQPENEYHYIIAQIANTAGVDRSLEFKHITYSEEYAD